MKRDCSLKSLVLAVVASFALAVPILAADTNRPSLRWFLPEAREVELGGSLGEAYGRGVKRLSLPPYDSPAYLRSDFSFETNRIFVNYSGDISGRFLQISSLVSPPGQMTPPTLPEVLQDVAKHQKADGRRGREVPGPLCQRRRLQRGGLAAPEPAPLEAHGRDALSRHGREADAETAFEVGFGDILGPVETSLLTGIRRLNEHDADE